MDIIPVIILLVVFVALLVFGFKLLKKSSSLKSTDEDFELKSLYKWSGRAFLFIALLMAILGFDRNVMKIPNPFSGPKIGNEMPNSASPAAKITKPDIKVEDGRVKMDDAADKHQEQLKQFEKAE